MKTKFGKIMADLGKNVIKSQLAQVLPVDIYFMQALIRKTHSGDSLISGQDVKILNEQIALRNRSTSPVGYLHADDKLFSSFLNFPRFKIIRDFALTQKAEEILIAASHDLKQIIQTGQALDTTVKQDEEHTQKLKPFFNLQNASRDPSAAQAAFAAADIAQLLTLLVNQNPQILQSKEASSTISTGVDTAIALANYLLGKDAGPQVASFEVDLSKARRAIIAEGDKISAALELVANEQQKQQIPEYLGIRIFEIQQAVLDTIAVKIEQEEHRSKREKKTKLYKTHKNVQFSETTQTRLIKPDGEITENEKETKVIEKTNEVKEDKLAINPLAFASAVVLNEMEQENKELPTRHSFARDAAITAPPNSPRRADDGHLEQELKTQLGATQAGKIIPKKSALLSPETVKIPKAPEHVDRMRKAWESKEAKTKSGFLSR